MKYIYELKQNSWVEMIQKGFIHNSYLAFWILLFLSYIRTNQALHLKVMKLVEIKNGCQCQNIFVNHENDVSLRIVCFSISIPCITHNYHFGLKWEIPNKKANHGIMLKFVMLVMVVHQFLILFWYHWWVISIYLHVCADVYILLPAV